MNTKTFFINIEKLKRCGEAGSIAVRLMMACNDIILANQSMGIFKKEFERREYIKRGALLYLLRLLVSHFNEGIKILLEIKQNEILNKALQKCTDQEKSSFKKLINCLSKDDPEYKKIENDIGRIRHNITFHYDKKSVAKAISNWANKKKVLSITRGSHMELWRYSAADDIIDTIICRQIFGIDLNADLRKKADEKIDYFQNLCISFIDFCGEFIFKFSEEYLAI